MSIKRPKSEEIVAKLRQVEVLMGQGMPRIDAIRQIGVTEQTYCRWKKKYSGMGIFDTLSQRDHWRMIDAGWFGNEDLFTPQPNGDPSYITWCAIYKPELEAYDLLMDIFSDRAFSPVGLNIPEFCLTLAEHPCSPRYATATIDDASVLPALATYVARQSDWVMIHPTPREPNIPACKQNLQRATTISGRGIL